MNRILLDPAELADPLTLTGPRALHIHTILKSTPGDTLKIGLINGPAGSAELLASTPDSATLRVLNLDDTPPPPWIDLLLAVPRPRAMKRLWPQLATFGVRNIHLLNSAKVEKTYFASHILNPDTYVPLLIDGLMQSGATALPAVHFHTHFPAFIANTLPGLVAASPLALLAHPGPATPLPSHSPATPPLLAIGPDGGWTPDEHAHFLAAGFHPFSLGARPLRTDTACIALLATLHYVLNVETPSPK